VLKMTWEWRKSKGGKEVWKKTKKGSHFSRRGNGRSKLLGFGEESRAPKHSGEIESTGDASPVRGNGGRVQRPRMVQVRGSMDKSSPPLGGRVSSGSEKGELGRLDDLREEEAFNFERGLRGKGVLLKNSRTKPYKKGEGKRASHEIPIRQRRTE